MDGLMDDGEQPMPEGGAAADPFLGDSQRLAWSRVVEIGQLQTEVTQALGPNVRLAVLEPFDEAGAPVAVDAGHPLVVFVSPRSASLDAVRQVLAAHRPDPYFGMTDEQKAHAQLREKIASGAELSPGDVQMALQMLISPQM